MKRFSVMLLALVFVVAFTVPAMAIHIGSAGTTTPDTGLSVSGTYKIDGEMNSSNIAATALTPSDKSWYDDDFELVLRAYMGDVTATVDLEVSDNSTFSPAAGTIQRSGDIVDNYYIQWKATDALALKIGEYGTSFGSTAGFYSQGHEKIGATYALDNVTFGLYLAKLIESGSVTGSDYNDSDLYILTANFKDVGTFTKLNVIYASGTNDVTTAADDTSFIGLDFAVPAGPVDLSVEYGAVGNDANANDGSYFLIGVGLTKLINMDKFGLTFNFFSADEDCDLSTFESGDNWDPFGIYGVKTNALAENVDLYWVKGTYAYSDKLGLNFLVGSGSEGQAVAMPDGFVGVDGSIGTEIDLGGSYKLADNVTYQAAFQTWSPGSDFATGVDDTYTKLFHRLTFKF